MIEEIIRGGIVFVRIAEENATELWQYQGNGFVMITKVQGSLDQIQEDK